MNDQHYLFEELEIAKEAALEAGWIIMALYGKDYQIEEKGKGNPVTTADLEANRKIQEIIRARYPKDGWLSEENNDDLKRLEVSRVWVVDPIDGTKEFIEGIPQFVVSVGLVVEGRAVLGVVYNPVEQELYAAVKGCGTVLNGHPIHVSLRKEVRGASLLVSRSESRRRFKSVAEICHLEAVGSIAYRLAKVAEGKGDGTLTFRSLHEWDVCAGALIAEEAGGVVIDGSGKALLFNRKEPVHPGIIAANEALTRILQGMWAKGLNEKG